MNTDEKLKALLDINQKIAMLKMSMPQKKAIDIFKFVYPALKVEDNADLLCCFEDLLVDIPNCINEKILAYELEFQNLINSYAENPNQ